MNEAVRQCRSDQKACLGHQQEHPISPNPRCDHSAVKPARMGEVSSRYPIEWIKPGQPSSAFQNASQFRAVCTTHACDGLKRAN